MTLTEDLLPAGALLAAGGWFGHVIVQWLRNRSADHSVDRNIDAQMEQHWTKTMLELVSTLRNELAEAKIEITALRPMEARLAHLEEALDHIHALLSSDSDAERRAAERRARAFMRRMRGDDAKGELRNAVQAVRSARNLIDDQKGDTQ
jgi:hypothetical protein